MKNYRSLEPCLVCGERGENKVTYHHIKSRKSGGGDEIWNLMPLCLRHHNEIHSKGTTSFVKKYSLETFMTDFGWEKSMDKWYHPKTD